VVADMTECTVMTGTGLHRVDRVFTHKDYTGDHGWHDIALVHVVTPFTLAKFPPVTDGTEQLGQVVAAAGYGVTGRLSSGYTQGDNEIRAGTMLLTARERSVWVCEIRRTARRCRSVSHQAIAAGDSGAHRRTVARCSLA
jgi:hypothetical protein